MREQLSPAALVISSALRAFARRALLSNRIKTSCGIIAYWRRRENCLGERVNPDARGLTGVRFSCR
mgnify:CR=1 FL=1